MGSGWYEWPLRGIGFVASTLHLGSSARAFNSLNPVGASSLSNEIASDALSLAFVLVLAGELIGRGVFYGLHMTAGMAVAS
jgi:DMSO reductase anchor subunit